jgi:hypothetical protein
MKIQLCKKFTNINKLQKKLASTFEEDTIVIKSCIDMCKNCKHQPAAKADGTKLKAKHISKLILKIKKL